jgi:hypothetical protein
LFLRLAIASNEDLALAWLLFLAGEGSVAHVLVWMTTHFLGFATLLLAGLAIRIFALSRPVARFTTEVRSTTQLVATYVAATHILQPALLVLESLLPAHAPLLHKKGAFGTSLIVLVTVVRHLRVATCFRAFAGVSAWW